MNKLFKLIKGQRLMFEKSVVKCRMLRNFKFRDHLSSNKAMFHYITSVFTNNVFILLYSTSCISLPSIFLQPRFLNLLTLALPGP